jgi:hypothetical protein
MGFQSFTGEARWPAALEPAEPAGPAEPTYDEYLQGVRATNKLIIDAMRTGDRELGNAMFGVYSATLEAYPEHERAAKLDPDPTTRWYLTAGYTLLQT